MYFIQTTDVELISIPLNKPVPEMAEKVLKIGLPRVLDLYSKYDIEGTFFFTGKIVEIEPEVIDIVKERGHEIGCHGYTHYSTEGFDVMPYDKQVEYLLKAKEIIEKEAGKILSFKSPELRIGKNTIRALEETGFEIDCSVASQRFDGLVSYGSKNKIGWLFAPRKPYFLSYDSAFQRGDSKIFEIPVSALIFPYMGTTMRIFPRITRFIERALFFEARNDTKPILFIFHPNECIEGKNMERTYYSNGPISYFRDVFRQDLKMKSLGIKAVKLMEEILQRARKKGFEFVSVKKYRDIFLKGFGG